MAMHVKELIHSLFKKEQNNHWQVQLLANWPSIVGKLKAKIVLEKIQQQNTLVLGVSNSSWLQEMYLLSDVLKQRINDTLDEPRITQLRFKLLESKKIKQHHKQQISKQPLQEVQFSQHEIQVLRAIKDEQLRKALSDFLVRCHQQRMLP